jgi:uncharacterized membrane protein
MENRFKVIYTGELQPYVSAQEAIRNVASIFKMSEDRVRALVLSGRAQEIKVNLDAVTAERYVSALSKAGLSVRVEPMAATPKADLRLTPITLAEAESAVRETPKETCPKCGSARMRDGACLDCGVVAAKYRARQTAPERGTVRTNPYAPPVSELTADVDAMESETMAGPRNVPARHGWGWITQGFHYFSAYPWSWMLATVVFIGCLMVVSLVPFLGVIATYLLSPILSGGMMLGAYEQDHGGRFRIEHVFAGFSNQLGQLALLGALYLGGLLLILIPVFLLAGLPVILAVAGLEDGAVAGQGPEAMDHFADAVIAGQVPWVILGGLIAVLLSIPLLMAYWFAPTLIAVNGMRAWPAMKLSFRACLWNILPFLVYGIIGILLMFATILTLGLALFVLLPVLLVSVYASYRDIFYYDSRWSR